MIGGLTAARLGSFDVQRGGRLVRLRAEMSTQQSDHLGGAQMAVDIDDDQGLRCQFHFKRRLQNNQKK